MEIYKRAWVNYYKNYEKYIGYQMLSAAIMSVFLMPLFSFLFNALMKVSGNSYIANGLLQKFLISPFGILVILISLIMGFVLLLLNLGGLVVIAHQSIIGSEQSRFIDIVMYAFKRLKYLFGLDGILLVIYFVVLAPLIDAEYSIAAFDRLQIPGFVMDTIQANALYNILLGLGFLVVVYLSVKWMYALHILLLENLSDKKILKRCKVIFKNHWKKILKSTFQHSVFDLLIGFGVMFIIIVPVGYLISGLGLSIDYLVAFIIFLFITLLYVISNIAVTLGVIRMTMIYHDFEESNVEILKIKTVDVPSKFNKFLSNKLVLVLSFIFMIVGVLGYTYVFDANLKNARYDVDITAHRGSSVEAPENTLSAIKLAVENGADFVEIDVQLTKDKKIILLHDKTFMRTSNVDKRPDELNLDEIKTFDNGAWFSKDFIGEPVVTLEEVMAYSEGKIKLNIEMKGTEYSPDLTEHLVKLIEQKAYQNNCVITSLVYDDLLKVEELKPNLDTGYIMFIALGDLSQMKTDFYSVEAANVTEAFVEKAHDSGRQVHVWTINERPDMEAMMDMGVDNIITDQDALLKEIIEERKSGNGLGF